MMPYWQRVVLGALLGLFAVMALWYFVGITWLTAAIGGLVAPLVFLGSFFLFSADRPDEGYEQVLFDKPNTILAVGMIVVFAGLGVASGFVEIDASVGGREMSALASEFQTARDEYEAGTLAPEDGAAQMDALLAELGDPGDETSAAAWLAKALAAQKACFEGDDAACQGAFDAFIEYRLAGGSN